MSIAASAFKQQYFHGTRADLATGSELTVGHPSNFSEKSPLSWIYFAATLDAAIWGAELALGNGQERIYVVEPTGDYEDDPNVTDKRFRGNPTLSYRSRKPLRIVAEVTGWLRHTSERINEMKSGIARLKAEGADIIID